MLPGVLGALEISGLSVSGGALVSGGSSGSAGKSGSVSVVLTTPIGAALTSGSIAGPTIGCAAKSVSGSVPGAAPPLETGAGAALGSIPASIPAASTQAHEPELPGATES